MLNDKINGTIVWLKCKDCLAEYPTFIFSGDTDMATSGYRAYTSIESKKLFLYSMPEKLSKGTQVRLIRVDKAKPRKGEDFQAYLRRANNAKPVYVYKCIACTEGRSLSVKCMTTSELVKSGYDVVYE
ncbi:hypothetical protein SAMN02745181_0484 [Rubritalea squalenifaciens DSM 18772]|uniref:Uncharacterized protein n=1 Tax=Rubritalea squalenifaciens DSM 18772 TaxID=1123071 RepID=A0A1M6CHT0_9BACT|nr:hypothetical protein SAMN02745181_0484 [Rubritalea squalenifaciens DSM 18772]